MAEPVQITIIGRDQASASLAKVRGEVRGLGSDADGAGGLLSKLGGVVGTLGKVALGVAAGGLIALGGALIGGVADARAHAQVMAQTEQVIKSMGNAAGVSVEHVEAFAASLSAASGKSLFGDDQIQAATNMLLTFGNIKGEVLDLATTLSVDMAQALKSTPEQMSMMIGKLLNSADAMSAAQRMGVSFTDEQIKLGKAMFEAGDIAGYQAMVMAELNKEFGGQAEAAARADGGWAQFKDRLGETAETLGGLLLPALNEGMAFLNETVMPVVETAAAGLGELAAVIADAGIGSSEFAETVGYLASQLGLNGEAVQAFVQILQDTLGAVIPVVAGLLAGDLAGSLDQTGINFTEIAATISGVMAGIEQVVGAVLAQVAVFWASHGAEITAFAQEAWSQIAEIVNTAIQIVNEAVIPALQGIAAFISAHGTEIQLIFDGVWNAISAIISGVLATIQGIINATLAIVRGDWEGAWEAIKGIADAQINMVKGIIDGVLSAIAGIFGTTLDEIGANVATAFGEMVTNVTTKIGEIVGIIKGLPAKVVGVGEAVVTMIWDGLKAQWDAFMADVRGKLQELRDMLPFSEPRDSSSPLYGLGKSGTAIVEMLAGGLERGGDALPVAMAEIAGRTRDQAQYLVDDLALQFERSDLPGNVEGFGQDVMSGLIEGMEGMLGDALDLIDEIGEQMGDQFNDALDLGSPSHMTELVGENVMLGLLGGLEAMLPALLSTIQTVASVLTLGLDDLGDDARRAMESLIDDLAQTVETLPDRVHGAIADAFDATADIAEQQSRNIDAVRRLASGLQGETQQALDAALAEAQQIEDPEEAARFFQMRSNQILKLAKLQSDYQAAINAGDMQHAADLQRQIELAEQAQAAERAAFEERSQISTGGTLGALTEQIQQILDALGEAGMGEDGLAAQLYDLLVRLSAAASGTPLPAPGVPTAPIPPPSIPPPGGPPPQVPQPTPMPLGAAALFGAGAIVIQGYSANEGQAIAERVMAEIERRYQGRF